MARKTPTVSTKNFVRVQIIMRFTVITNNFKRLKLIIEKKKEEIKKMV